MPGAIRSRAETALGTNLGNVRLTESGPLAAHVAARGADAGTRQNVIAFPRGLPDLNRPEGRFALGHELAHVVQQDRGVGPNATSGAALEAGADSAARRISGLTARNPRRAQIAPEQVGGAPVQFGAFEVLGRGMRAVNDVVAPVLDPVMQVTHQAVAEVLMSAFDIPALAMDFITNLPFRLMRLMADQVQGVAGVSAWLVDFVGLFLNWQGWNAVWNHLFNGVLDGAAWAGEFLIHALEVIGVAEALQFLWARFNRLAPLNSAQIGAAQEVHPPGLIPYSRVRVDYDSLIARLSALISGSGNVAQQLFGTAGAQHRAVTTMHVIHTGHTMDEPLSVHELTHVAQYELVGSMYMPEAVHAQEFGQGYDYQLLDGGLATSIANGRTYADFNREQQAMICEDYYRHRHGLPIMKGGAASDLEYFVNDYWGRAGVPLLRMFLDQ